MDATARIELVRELCSFDRRLAGTDAERRGAARMAERLREAGHRVEIEPTYVHPQHTLVHAVHCLAGFAGSLIAVAAPAAGFALVLATAISMYLDLNHRVYLLRYLFFRRASQNVVASGPPTGAPARVILTAHLDAARTGAAFEPRRMRRSARLAARIGLPLGPFRVLFWSLAALLPILGARMAGLDSNLVAMLQLVPTFTLLLGAFALVDIRLSAASPGANDNASGVATVISLARVLGAEPPRNLDVWVVLTGGEECLQEGMRAFVRSRRKQLDRELTWFINVNAVGRGEHVRYLAAGGWVVTHDMDPRLLQLCAAIAEADHERSDGQSGDRYRARPIVHGFAGDEMPARLAGFAATSIACTDEVGYSPGLHRPTDTPDQLDPAALERAHGFLLGLIRQLDREAGRRLDANTAADESSPPSGRPADR